MCLAQFATYYTYTSKFPKKAGTFNKDGVSDLLSDKEIFIEDENGDKKVLPCYVDLSDQGLGKLALRNYPAVLRLHDSQKKEGHEQYYAEMLLYYPWRNETEELYRENADQCIQAYSNRRQVIDLNKKCIFPNYDTMKNLLMFEDYDGDLESERPCHIYDTLDSQRMQERYDDMELGFEDEPEFIARNPIGLKNKEVEYHEDIKYKQIEIPEEVDLHSQTRKLVPEQLDVVNSVIEHCKKLKKNQKHIDVPIPGALLICHGGAGVGKTATIKVTALWAEKILRKPGDNPNHPRVLICAPTGTAAFLIGKQYRISYGGLAKQLCSPSVQKINFGPGNLQKNF